MPADETGSGGLQGEPRSFRRPRRSLRRGVALIFAAAVVVTAVALSLSAYFFTKAALERDALQKALAQSRFNLVLAGSLLPEDPARADFDRLVTALQIRGDFVALIETPSDTYVSGQDVSRDLVSPDLASRVSAGRLAYQSVRVADVPALAVGGLLRPGGPTLYFFFSQAALLAQLASLRAVLALAGFVLALLGVGTGYVVARRLLAPVGTASAAAWRMADGDLSIRLPAGADEFGLLAASFNRMAENLEARMTDLEMSRARERRFVADVAHELRTPVAALVGEASLVHGRLAGPEAGALSPEMGALVGMVTRDIARLRQLVDDLLEISRLDAQAAEVLLEPVDVAPFLQQLKTARNWPPDVGLESTPPPPRVVTDKRRLERIVVNLVENALRHGAPPVKLHVWAASGSVCLTVEDRGPGIAEQHLPHVFDRFYKADPSRSASPGSGLGLAIARENARLLGGEITVESRPSGTLFLLALPISSEPGTANP